MLKTPSGRKLKISPYVVKRYEPLTGLYYFYNAKNKTFWECPYNQGAVVSALDGTLTEDEIFEILYSNNTDIKFSDIRKNFGNTFEFLIKEEFIIISFHF